MPKRKKKPKHTTTYDCLYPEATLVISEYCCSKDSFTPQPLTLHNISLFSLYVKDAQKVTRQSLAWMTKILSTTLTEIFTMLSKNKANLEKDTTLGLILYTF